MIMGQKILGEITSRVSVSLLVSIVTYTENHMLAVKLSFILLAFKSGLANFTIEYSFMSDQ